MKFHQLILALTTLFVCSACSATNRMVSPGPARAPQGPPQTNEFDILRLKIIAGMGNNTQPQKGGAQ